MICNNCGGEFEYKEGLGFCPLCGVRIQEAQEQYYCPWENRAKLGILEGLFTTWKETIVESKNFFKKLPPTGFLGSAILYTLIIAGIGNIIGFLWQIGWNVLFSDFGNLPFQRFGGAEIFQKFFSGVSLIFIIILIPIVLIIYLFMLTGIVHLFLMIIGGANKGIETTLKAISYAQSPQIFQLVPLCGGLVAAIWSIVLEIIAIREVHRTTTGKAAFAVLFPMVICCFLISLAILIPIIITGREIFR